MRRVISIADRVGPALEAHFHRHGVRPARRFTYRGKDVYLAEGGPHFDAHPAVIDPTDAWMLAGYYVSVWGVQNGLAVLGRPMYFKLDHDPNRSAQANRAGRLEAAEVDAKEHIDSFYLAGHFKVVV